MSFFGPGNSGSGFISPPVLNPLAISGLLAWYDASDNATLTLSGSELTQILDKSGNGYHSTDDAARRPTADGDYNDTTFYNADKVHLTTAGYAKIAALVKTTVDTL